MNIITKAAVLKKDFSESYPKLVMPVAVVHFESFYNFRTIGEDFKIVTSVLSLGTDKETHELVLKKGEKDNKGFEVEYYSVSN